jgi:hypothetical protein
MNKGDVCWVVAPSLIPNKAGDRVKTDRRDAIHTTWKVMSQISDTLKNSCFEIKGLRKQH